MSTVELDKLTESIITGDLELAVAVTEQALSENMNPQELISNYMIKGMEEIGSQFENGDAYVPELLMAARAMKGALALIKPLLQKENVPVIGKVVIGTVYGDLHDIGKNLVASMLEGCGFEIIDLGVDVPAERFVEEAIKEKANLILCSALLTTTMSYLKTVVEAVDKAGLRPSVKIMVGGAPVTEGIAKQIGADGYSDNANSAVKEAKRLLGIQ